MINWQKYCGRVWIWKRIYEIMGLEEKVHIEQVLPADIEHRSFEIIGEELKAMGKELEPELGHHDHACYPHNSGF